MKILAMADLHSQQFSLPNLQDIDLVIVAGDLTNFGEYTEYKKVFKYLQSLNKPVIFTVGNHDRLLHFYDVKSKYRDLIFLDNNTIEYKGLKIYGTPYSSYCGWYNHYHTLDECKELTIPKEKVDIIITHEPPMCPELSDIYNANNELLKYLYNNTGITVISGHIHEKSGNFIEINGNRCYNVARTYKIMEVCNND